MTLCLLLPKITHSSQKPSSSRSLYLNSRRAVSPTESLPSRLTITGCFHKECPGFPPKPPMKRSLWGLQSRAGCCKGPLGAKAGLTGRGRNPGKVISHVEFPNWAWRLLYVPERASPRPVCVSWLGRESKSNGSPQKHPWASLLRLGDLEFKSD